MIICYLLFFCKIAVSCYFCVLVSIIVFVAALDTTLELCQTGSGGIISSLVFPNCDNVSTSIFIVFGKGVTYSYVIESAL